MRVTLFRTCPKCGGALWRGVWFNWWDDRARHCVCLECNQFLEESIPYLIWFELRPNLELVYEVYCDDESSKI